MNTVESIKDKIAFKDEGKSVNVLFSEGFKVVGLALKSQQKLEKHSTSTPAFLLVLEGKIDFLIGENKTTLAAQDFIKIHANELHEIIAIDNSKMILIK